MTTITRLFTLFRGQVRAGSEAILDANALALLDQQLFDTEQSLISARRDLAALMAERMLQENSCSSIARRSANMNSAPAKHWPQAMRHWRWKLRKELPNWKVVACSVVSRLPS